MRLLLFCLFLFCWFQNLQGQTTLFVNNENDGTYRDYSDLQEAIDAAEEGAVIYVAPSGTKYGSPNGVVISKKISLYGGGYENQLNAELGTNLSIKNTEIQKIEIEATAIGTLVRGVRLDGVSRINASNCVIENCRGGSITLDKAVGTNIAKNYLVSIRMDSSSSSIIKNNIVISQSTAGGIICQPCGGGDIISNNIFLGEVNGSDNHYFNNVFLSSVGTSDNVYSNNIFKRELSALIGGNNLFEVNESAIFVGYPEQGEFSFDQRFRLKENSPAKGYGTNDTDCGAYGGTNPYIPSGVAAGIPVIYELTAPESAPMNGTLNVTVKARTGN